MKFLKFQIGGQSLKGTTSPCDLWELALRQHHPQTKKVIFTRLLHSVVPLFVSVLVIVCMYLDVFHQSNFRICVYLRKTNNLPFFRLRSSHAQRENNEYERRFGGTPDFPRSSSRSR
eukprot:gb/GECG01015479.1/.p1 GENE.gb/GECG01015479.1/~~gb/GECG01015479.1/.p1  ORF type:complete len:117 (+),score=2.62 gb/GECG01015479.1/:1-351(+)